MRLKPYRGGAFMLAAFFICPALGHCAEANPLPTASTRGEAPITKDSTGFMVFEHRLRPIPFEHQANLPRRSAHRASDLRNQVGTRVRANSNQWRRLIYLSQVSAAEARYALPRGLLDALLWTESRYNALAMSKAGAAGLGQLMPATARELGVTNRFDPGTSILGAAQYLRQMLDRFGLVHLAVAAYNAGPNAVERAGRVPANGETPGYVASVLNTWRLQRYP